MLFPEHLFIRFFNVPLWQLLTVDAYRLLSEFLLLIVDDFLLSFLNDLCICFWFNIAIFFEAYYFICLFSHRFSLDGSLMFITSEIFQRLLKCVFVVCKVIQFPFYYKLGLCCCFWLLNVSHAGLLCFKSWFRISKSC